MNIESGVQLSGGSNGEQTSVDGGSKRLNIAFSSDDQLSPLSAEVKLCLFRVAQESLANVIKHSGATSVEVRLCRAGKNNGTRLIVIDDG